MGEASSLLLGIVMRRGPSKTGCALPFVRWREVHSTAQSSERLQGHHPLLSQLKASGGPGPVAGAPGACKGLSQHPSALPQFQVPVVDARPLT